MKNKKILILLVISLFFNGITVLATVVNASDIKYTPKESTWNVTNAQAAINDLYDYSRKDTLDKLPLTTTDKVSQGAAIPTRPVTLSLEKGSYLVFASHVVSIPNTTKITNKYASVDWSPILSYTNGTCSQIIGKEIDTTGTAQLPNTTNYINTENLVATFKCTFTTSGSITISAMAYDEPIVPQTLFLNSIKLD